MILENVNVATPPNVSFLRGKELETLDIMKGVDLFIENGIIKKIIKSRKNSEPAHWIIPGFVDSHSHPIFCGMRGDEIDLRKKMGYEGVLKSGGGIYRTVRDTNSCERDELYKQSRARIETMIMNGTTSIEAKTGYGLTLESEGKMLETMSRIEKDLGIRIRKTLLAHVPPRDTPEYEFLHKFKEMIDVFKDRIDYVDVFLDDGAFSPQFAREVFIYANRKGIPGRVHINEIKNLNGIEMLRDLDIRSYDHMLETRVEEIDGINGVINFLPFTSLTLGKNTSIFREFLNQNKIIGMGSDVSPNSYILSMPLIIGLARQLSPFTLEQLLNMATINSAYSLGIDSQVGTIHENKEANFIVLKSSYKDIGYVFGNEIIEEVFVGGRPIKGTMEINLIE
ncbi:MAG: amidohydrolase family protein [Thermoplasmata archaeon]